MIHQYRLRKKDGFPHEKLYVIPRPVLDFLSANPVLRGFVVSDAGHFPHARHHLRQREAGCEEHIFIFCIEGKGFLEIDGQEFSLRKNQAITIPAGTPHVYGADLEEPWSIYWFHFVGDFVPIYMPHPLTSRVVDVNGDMIRIILNLFEQILTSLSQGTSAPYLMTASSAAGLVLLTTYRDVYIQAGISQGPGAREIEEMIAYIQHHLDEPITLVSLSERSDYSISRITQLFKEFTGHSPMEFVQHQRIQRACYYLDSTPDPISIISEHVGFGDQFYFSRVFKKIVGVSPRSYRQRFS